MEWTDGEPNAVGSRYHSVGVIPGDKDHHNDGTITENKPYERFALTAQDDGDLINTFTLSPDGGGTRVEHTLKFPDDMKGAARFLLPILFPLVGKPQINKRMQLLKQRVEGSS